MGNKIAVNAKYFKASEVSSISGHIMRLFAKDKNENLRPHLTKNNFGTSSKVLDKNYKNAIEKVKNLKKKSNTLVDAVFVFPLEQWEKMKANGATKKDIHDAMVKVMLDIENKTGLQPIGYQMHLDEAKLNVVTGELELNPHAHMLFANICRTDVTLTLEKKITKKGLDGKALRDPLKPSKWLYERDEDGNVKTLEYSKELKGKMPLQYLQGRGSGSVWSDMQDLAANGFSKYGFERGISKEVTGRKHLEKLKWLQKVANDAVVRADKAELREKQSKLHIISHFEEVQKLITLAIKGDVVRLKRLVVGIVESYRSPLMDGVRERSKGFINETVDYYSDSMKPESKPEIENLQRCIDIKVAQRDENKQEKHKDAQKATPNRSNLKP